MTRLCRLAVIVLLGCLFAATGPASAQIILGGGDTERPDPSKQELSEPEITAPAGTLQYVMPGQPEGGGIRYGGGRVTVTDARRFAPAGRARGIVNKNAVVVDLRHHPARLVAALDSREPGAMHYDVLRLDFTAKGDFRNAPVVERTRLGGDRASRSFTYWFVGWPVNVTRKGLDLPLRLQCVYTEREDPGGRPSREFDMMIRLCAQGRCRFGDKTHVLRLHDCNANLCVIDLSTPTVEQGRPRYPKKADFFHVDPEDGGKEHLAEAVYGHPLLLHGRLWNVTVSADGTSVAAKPYEAPVGRLAFDNASWEATLVGAKHVVHLKGGRDPVPVPVDRYLMTIFKENRLNRKGEVTCRLDMYASGWKPEHQVVVDVKADGRHEIAIGSPLNVTLEVTQKEGRLHFKPVITDRAGRPIYGHGYLQQIHGPYMPHWNPEVTITIVSPDGERVAGITRKLVDDVSWPVPPGLRGAYTATITYPDDAFPYECKPAAFTIR